MEILGETLPMITLLIINADSSFRSQLCTKFIEYGYSAIQAENGEQALLLCELAHIDLIIADFFASETDQIHVLRDLHNLYPHLPTMIVTQSAAPSHKKRAFEAGADDYVIRPVDFDELLWRTQALIRRANLSGFRKITIGSTIIDDCTMTVTTGSLSVSLPQKEFLLLHKLAASPERIFTRDQLMDDIWGPDSFASPHTLEVHISRLRRRFASNPDFRIKAIRGVGYKLVAKEKLP